LEFSWAGSSRDGRREEGGGSEMDGINNTSDGEGRFVCFSNMLRGSRFMRDAGQDW
jgi:hypothetical protein